MSILLVILVVLYAFAKAELIGYWIHRLMHSPRAGFIYKMHMEHHTAQYPKSDFVSDKYRNSKGPSTFLIYFPLVVVLAAIHWFLMPVYLFIPYLAVVSVAGLIQDYVHEGSHLRKFWLQRYKWYRRMSARHHVHHIFQHTNFGIYLFALDRIFGTFYKKAR